MNILYLITKSEAGGAQTHVYQLCDFFRTKHDITVMAAPGGWLEKKCEELGIPFIANPYFSNSLNPLDVLKAYRFVKSTVKTLNPDIVHCHSSVAGFIGRLAIRGKIPTVFTAHGWGFNIGVPLWQKWVAILAERMVSRHTSAIICVSTFVKELALRYRIAPKEILHVVHNGVKVRDVQNAKSSHKKVELLFVGRLVAPKRPLLLLQAISLLSSHVRDQIHVRIIGEGPEKNALQAYIKAHQLDSTVDLLGGLPREEIFDMFDTSDALVFLSDWEGFPMTILEAMSAGLPIIASRVGGVGEMVDTSNGMLIENNRKESVSEAIARLVDDPSLRVRMGTASHKKIQQDFSLERMCQKMDAVYQDCIR